MQSKGEYVCSGNALHLYLRDGERPLGRGEVKMKDKQELEQSWGLRLWGQCYLLRKHSKISDSMAHLR